MGQKAHMVHDESPRTPVLLPSVAPTPKAIIVLEFGGHSQGYFTHMEAVHIAPRAPHPNYTV